VTSADATRLHTCPGKDRNRPLPLPPDGCLCW